MKKIILGWSFGGENGLKKAIKKSSNNTVDIVDVKDITALDKEHVYTGKNFKPHKIKEFSSSFIRYPYDLIPPYTQTYSARESTEFLKTLALIFSPVSINPITYGSISRNRMYSLSIADSCGLQTPLSFATKSEVGGLKGGILPKKLITKCLGNCYFSEKLNKKDTKLKKYLSFEEDGGDTAYIYPAHKILNKKQINDHIKHFKICFLQKFVEGAEFRMYLVGNKIYSYKRAPSNREDRSADAYLKEEVELSKTIQKKLLLLKKKLHLQYLCLDVVFNSQSKSLVVIDINPYGSLPEYSLDPRPIDGLARLILQKGTGSK